VFVVNDARIASCRGKSVPHYLSSRARSVGDPTAVSILVAPCVIAPAPALARPSYDLQKCSPRPRSRFLRLVLFAFLTTAMTIPTSLMLNYFIFQFLSTVVTSVQNHHSTLQEFSERFKYDVISSSLLASSITTPSSTRRRSPSLPDDSFSDDPDLNPTTQLSPPPPPSQPAVHRGPAQLLSLFSLFLISVFVDSFLLYLFIVTALYYLESYALVSGHVPDFIPPVSAFPPICPISH
jgi:hypothetical protein